MGRLPWILAGGLALRLLLLTGTQGTDELAYSQHAFTLLGGGFDGYDVFFARLGYVAPLAVGFALFGVHQASLILPGLVASMLLIVLAWRLGKALHGEQTARLAALLVAVLPSDIRYSTMGLGDVPLAAAGSWALYQLWRPAPPSDAGARAMWAALGAGLLFGFAHLIKETAFLFFIPLLPWLRDRRRWPQIAVAAATFAAIVGVEMTAYWAVTGDPLMRVHLSRQQVDIVRAAEESVSGRALDLVTTMLLPGGAGFFLMASLWWLALPGAAVALARDRRRWSWIVVWMLGLTLAHAFWPMTVQPFRPALSLHIRFFTGLVVPGALLAARFVVEVSDRLGPRIAQAGVAFTVLFSLLCSAINHGDAVPFRAGSEWASTMLAMHPGSVVVTDARTMRLLQFLSGYRPSYQVRFYSSADPPPRPGTLLLDNPRLVDAVAGWDSTPAPSWWRATTPARAVVGEILVPGRFRLRGPPFPPDRVVLSRVLTE